MGTAWHECPLRPPPISILLLPHPSGQKWLIQVVNEQTHTAAFHSLSFLSPTPDPPMPCLPPPPKLENPYRANLCLSLTPPFQDQGQDCLPRCVLQEETGRGVAEDDQERPAVLPSWAPCRGCTGVRGQDGCRVGEGRMAVVGEARRAIGARV